MTPEKLLRKRYKLIADYPFNNLLVGSIIEFDIESVWVTHNGELYSTNTMIAGLASSYYYHNVVKVINYPHLFKKLEWWEDRKLEDMPKYLKYQTSQETRPFVIYPAKFTKDGDGWMVEVEKYIIPHGNYLKDKLPATGEEYLNQSK